MKQLTSIEQLKGQTIIDIKTSELYSTMCLILENGQYATIEIDRAYESCDDTVILAQEEPDEDLALEFGVITEEEFNAIVKERREQYQAYKDKEDRKEYERLKAKFEGSGIS